MKHFADLLLNKNNSDTNDQVPFIQKRRGIEIKSSREINLMKKSSRIVATVLREINDLIKPGMSTKDLDDFAEKRIRDFGAVPSFKGYHGFPSSICSSINNEVVHEPLRRQVLRGGGDEPLGRRVAREHVPAQLGVLLQVEDEAPALRHVLLLFGEAGVHRALDLERDRRACLHRVAL